MPKCSTMLPETAIVTGTHLQLHSVTYLYICIYVDICRYVDRYIIKFMSLEHLECKYGVGKRKGF